MKKKEKSQQNNYPSLDLGLDLSTTVCGYCVPDNNHTIICLGYFDLSLYATILDKATALRRELGVILDRHRDISTVGLENFLMAHIATTKQTLIKLAQINILCQFIITNDFPDLELKVINVQTARKKVVPQLPRKIKGTRWKSQKDFIFEWFCETIGWDFAKKKNGSIIDQAKDMVDSYVICKAISSSTS